MENFYAVKVIFSGLEIKSPTLYTAFGSIVIVLLDFALYSTKSNPENEGYYFAEGLKPVAAHCIGYPLVSIGYCMKRYMAYLLRLRKQNEVEAKNKYYYNLLYEALPPSAYNHSSDKVWEKDFLELEPDRDDGESSTSSKSERDTKPDKDSPGWSQRLKDIFQDLTCFSNSSRSHLLTVKEPGRSQSNSGKNSSGGSNLRAYRLYRWLESIACWLPSDNCQKSENTNNSKHNNHTKKNHHETGENGDGQYSRHTPTKKEKNNLKNQSNGEHLYTQIQKQDSIKNDDSQSNQNSNKLFMPKTLPKCPFPKVEPPKTEAKIEEPSARGDSDAAQAELGRIKRENEKLKKNEIQLKGKIDDLTQHEEFTKNNSRTSRSETRAFAISSRLSESELSSLNDRESENERLRHQLKKSEMDREMLIQDAKNREQELQHLRSKLAEGDLKINQLHRMVEERQQSVRNNQEKLQAESRLKLQLLERLNTQQQEIEDLRHRSTLYQRPVIHDFQ
ncbi:Oidioi.mRNA.OKI2018_I69.XSR.g13669.t2.cds [Oikopleura dioica]|uniref:Macoilin n=1 Tax=Oikopleura dioica TaxID=34765 RepID=A0ABN7S7J0_OIKDI|nr:Oidioi.mRNA.OKI2018_I69.XSR.g13669.t2.cds [Oikopleura dioica]